MQAFVLALFLGLAVWTGWLLHHYAHRSRAPAAVLGMVYLAWLACFAASLLLPADIMATQTAGTDSRVLDEAWHAMYWVTFVLSWAALPLAMEAWNSGEFSARARLAHSLRVNARFYAAMAAALLVFSLYVGVAQHLSVGGVLGFLMAAANTWGLLLIVMLLGYGLVSVPRRLWQLADAPAELKRVEYRAAQADADAHEAAFVAGEVLQEAAAALRGRQHPCAALVVQTVRELGSDAEADALPDSAAAAAAAGPRIDDAELVALHTRLRAALAVRRRHRLQWDALLDEAAAAGAAAAAPRPVRAAALRALAAGCGVLSALVVWGEVMLAAPVDLSVYGAIVDSIGGAHPWGVFCATLVPLGYMSLCVYRSLFHLKVFGQFHLQRGGLSDSYALMFNASYLCRLQFALGYNYLQALRFEAADGTAFAALMGRMNVLGEHVGVYAPLAMVLLALLSLFNAYSRVMRWVGVDSVEAPTIGNEDDESVMAEGRALIRRALGRRSRDGGAVEAPLLRSRREPEADPRDAL